MSDDAFGSNEVRPVTEVQPISEEKQKDNRVRLALASSVVVTGITVIDTFARSHGIDIPAEVKFTGLLAVAGMAVGGKDLAMSGGDLVRKGGEAVKEHIKGSVEDLLLEDRESREKWLEQTKANIEALDWQTKAVADSVRKLRAGIAEVNRDVASLTPWLLAGAPQVDLKMMDERPKGVSVNLRETVTESMKEKTKDKTYVDILGKLVDSVSEEIIRTKGKPDFVRVETALSDKLVKEYYKGDTANEQVARGWIEQRLKADENRMPTPEGKVFVGMLKEMHRGITEGSPALEQTEGAVLNFVVGSLDKVLVVQGQEDRREWYLGQLGINKNYPGQVS